MEQEQIPAWAQTLIREVTILNERLPNHVDWTERNIKDHEVRLRDLEKARWQTAYQDVKVQAGTTAGSLSNLSGGVYSQGNGSSVSNTTAGGSNIGITSHTNSGLGAFSTGTVYIADYTNTTYYKQFNYDFASMRINSNGFIRKGANYWADNGAIGKLSVMSTNSTTLNGTVSLYSITKGSDGIALTV